MIYAEIDIEDMEFDEDDKIFTYPCPCGDRFEVSIDDLLEKTTDIATCPNCGLEIQVIFEQVSSYVLSALLCGHSNLQQQTYLLKYAKNSKPDAPPEAVYV